MRATIAHAIPARVKRDRAPARISATARRMNQRQHKNEAKRWHFSSTHTQGKTDASHRVSSVSRLRACFPSRLNLIIITFHCWCVRAHTHTREEKKRTNFVPPPCRTLRTPQHVQQDVSCRNVFTSFDAGLPMQNNTTTRPENPPARSHSERNNTCNFSKLVHALACLRVSTDIRGGVRGVGFEVIRGRLHNVRDAWECLKFCCGWAEGEGWVVGLANDGKRCLAVLSVRRRCRCVACCNFPMIFIAGDTFLVRWRPRHDTGHAQPNTHRTPPGPALIHQISRRTRFTARVLTCEQYVKRQRVRSRTQSR